VSELFAMFMSICIHADVMNCEQVEVEYDKVKPAFAEAYLYNSGRRKIVLDNRLSKRDYDVKLGYLVHEVAHVANFPDGGHGKAFQKECRRLSEVMGTYVRHCKSH